MDEKKDIFENETILVASAAQKYQVNLSNDSNGEATVVIAGAEKERGSGIGQPVIDRGEWDKIIAEVDAKKSEEHKSNHSKSKHGKKKKHKKKKRHGRRRKKSKRHGPWFYVLLTILIIGMVGVGIVGYIVIDTIRKTPEIDPSNLYDLLSESSIMLDSDGNVADYISNSSNLRDNIEYKDIPEDLIWSLVCTEDKTFFSHHGFNYIRIFGAIWDTVKSGFSKKIQGTSTITQQLARNLYLSETARDHSYIRKIKEAYYTIIMERALTKEQILEAYFNTIYLGFNSEGVQAAAQAYFSKDVEDLNLVECAIIASLPQSPNKFSPVKRIEIEDVDNILDYDVILKTKNYITYYNNAIEDKVKLVLRNMVAQEHLDQAVYDELCANLHDNIRNCINPSQTVDSSEIKTTYFKDYVVDAVLSDLMSKLGKTEKEARALLYEGGLVIHTTLNSAAQAWVDECYKNDSLFANIPATPDGVNNITYDDDGNLIYPESKKIMFFKKENIFNIGYDNQGDTYDVFELNPWEYERRPDGSMVVYAGNRLNFYKTTVQGEVEISVEFKPFFERKNGLLYTTNGGYILIAQEYKTRDENGNLVIAPEYFTDRDDNGKLLNEGELIFNNDGSCTISPSIYKLIDAVPQPQSAFVLIENSTGKIAAMIGGRDITGNKLFNRAISPRQTGSAIKPLSIYSAVIAKGFENAKENTKMIEGKTAEEIEKLELLPTYNPATIIDDVPSVLNGELWPHNSDMISHGNVSLRYAMELSLNCCAVSIYEEMLTKEEIVDQLQRLGISTLVTDEDLDENDLTAGALALGGFIDGISPLEMCVAYACIANYGVYNSPTCYTKITNKQGDIILKAETESYRVLDEEVASMTIDLLKSVCYKGLGVLARLSSQETGGKTGTTTSNYDLWMCGITPKYSATFWEGSDYNLWLDGVSSYHAATAWHEIMEPIGALDPYERFELKGDFVKVDIDEKTGMLPVTGVGEGYDTPEENIVKELFIKGTEPTKSNETARTIVKICSETGYLATPECEEAGCAIEVARVQRASGSSWENALLTYELEATIEERALLYNTIEDIASDIPDYYCPVHNKDVETYPISEMAEFLLKAKAEEEEKEKEEPKEED